MSSSLRAFVLANGSRLTCRLRATSDPNESIVKDIDSKRTEQSYTKRAATIDQSIGKSNDWKSPIFSIVNAGKSHPAHTGKPMTSHGATGHASDAVRDAAHGASSHGTHGTSSGAPRY